MKKLKIFLVIPSFSTEGIGDSLIWYRNLYEPLLDLNHVVELFSIEEHGAKKPPKEWNGYDRDKFSYKILEAINRSLLKGKIDIFFSYLYDYHIESQLIQIIKEKGILTINFSCNNTHQFYLQECLAKVFDINLFSEKDAKKKFDVLNVNSLWFQMAANPNYYKKLEIEKNIDISFVGQNYSNRPYYLNFLLESGFNVQIFGYGWKKKTNYKFLRYSYNLSKRFFLLAQYFLSASTNKKYQILVSLSWKEFNNLFYQKWNQNLHEPVSDEKMINIFNSSKINLGFSEVFLNHNFSELKLKHLHLRDFEIPMAGGFYCIQYSDELTEFYEPNKEVVVYNTEYELKDKIEFYLHHDNERKKIQEAGYRRAQNCHTYQKRFNDLFNELFK